MPLDPKKERDEREAKAAQDAVKEFPPLDPPFPYRFRAFDEGWFGVDKDPPIPPRKKSAR